jgi:hypothetical protein
LIKNSSELKTFTRRARQLFFLPVGLMPRAWNLIKQDLDPVIRNKPPVSRYIAYGGRNWFPDENSKSLFDPAWTNQFEYDDDDTNNNYSEAYNSRMKKSTVGPIQICIKL